MTFHVLVDELSKLSMEEKEEAKNLLEKYLIEGRREEIYENYQDSLKEDEQGKLNKINNIDDLKKELQ